MKEGDHFTVDVGKETFEVRLVVDIRDGKLLSAAMRNPVTLVERECSDRELTRCGDPTLKATVRDVTLKLVP